MNLSKKSLNRLNGLKPNEDRFVEQRQTSSKTETIEVDFAEILKNSEFFKELEAGKECLVKNVHADGDKITIVTSKGKVEKETTEILSAAFEDLIKKYNEND